MSESSTVRPCNSAAPNGAVSHGSATNTRDTPQGPSTTDQCMGIREHDFPTESEDDSDSRSASSSNEENRANVGVAPPLDEREKHHVFFCYSSADAPWVKNMIEKLESDEFGFKCCFHERDFIPGKPIVENIVSSIQKSRKTVFVLSREFVSSRWCTYEMQMVMRRHLSKGEKLVIPVMLRECVVPDFVQHMTYLEEWTPYFFDKFIGALKESTSDDPSSQSDPFTTFTYNPNYNNGQQVLKIEAACACCPPCARFDDEIVPSELTSKGIRIPREDYLAAVGKLMESGKINGFTCCSSEACFWLPTILIMMPPFAIFMALMLTRFDGESPDDEAYIVYHRGFAILGVYLLLAVPCRCILRYVVNRGIDQTLVEMNTILAKSHILAAVTDNCSCYPTASLHFVYYERGSCLMKILEDLISRATPPSEAGNIHTDLSDQPSGRALSSEVCLDVDAATPLLSEENGHEPDTEDSSSQTSRISEFKAEAEVLLLKYSAQYVRLLVTKKLPQPGQSRGHTQQGACLCQLVEMHEFGWKLDRQETSVV